MSSFKKLPLQPQTPKPVDLQTARHQRTALYFALFQFVTLIAWLSGRAWFALQGDMDGVRWFVGRTLPIVPIWGITWIVACTTVGNSIVESRRVTWYGISALAMLAIPGIPIGIAVIWAWWDFLASA